MERTVAAMMVGFRQTQLFAFAASSMFKKMLLEVHLLDLSVAKFSYQKIEMALLATLQATRCGRLLTKGMPESCVDVNRQVITDGFSLPSLSQRSYELFDTKFDLA
jgi:hypothetical protein